MSFFVWCWSYFGWKFHWNLETLSIKFLHIKIKPLHSIRVLMQPTIHLFLVQTPNLTITFKVKWWHHRYATQPVSLDSQKVLSYIGAQSFITNYRRKITIQLVICISQVCITSKDKVIPTFCAIEIIPLGIQWCEKRKKTPNKQRKNPLSLFDSRCFTNQQAFSFDCSKGRQSKYIAFCQQRPTLRRNQRLSTLDIIYNWKSTLKFDWNISWLFDSVFF